MKNYRIEALILTLGTALGTALLGWFIYLGIAAFANKDRYVSVRGLAEREVKADHVIWPIVYKTTGNDLQKLHAHINTVGRDISQFLTSNGIETKEISLGAPQIIDVHADRYAGSDARLRDRYNVTFVVTVASNKVDVVRSLISRVGELLQKGIAISANEYGTNVEYEFQSLNKIKPQMKRLRAMPAKLLISLPRIRVRTWAKFGRLLRACSRLKTATSTRLTSRTSGW